MGNTLKNILLTVLAVVVVVVLFLPDGLLSLGRKRRFMKAHAVKDGEAS